MWVIDEGKKGNKIQCTNYECMCEIIITDKDIIHRNNFRFVICPICRKKILLIENHSDIEGNTKKNRSE